jgi:hypothetical protein
MCGQKLARDVTLEPASCTQRSPCQSRRTPLPASVLTSSPQWQADWGSGYWQQDMEQRCYTGSHLTAIWAIGIPGVVLLCIGAPPDWLPYNPRLT